MLSLSAMRELHSLVIPWILGFSPAEESSESVKDTMCSIPLTSSSSSMEGGLRVVRLDGPAGWTGLA